MNPTPIEEIKDQNSRSHLIEHIQNYALENKMELSQLLKDISSKKDISLNGLKKIISAQVSKPSIETQIKIYSYIYATNSVTELITKLPSKIATSIQNVYSGKDLIESNEIKALSRDSVFNSIYILTSGDLGISLETIKHEFGRKGLTTLDKMLELELVFIDENEIVKRKKSALMSRDFRKNLISFIANDMYNTETATDIKSNYSGCLIGDVTEEDYTQVLMEVQNSINNIKNIITNSKPTPCNYKKIALGAIVDELSFENKNEGAGLC